MIMITYLWQRVDGSKLDVRKTTGIASNKLSISNVTSSDAGSYVCVASIKDVEIVSRRTILYIKGLRTLEQLLYCIRNLCFHSSLSY